MTHARTPLTRTAALATLAAITLGGLTATAEQANAATSRTTMKNGIVASVNDIRADHGCRPLKVAKALTRSAQRHADDMARTRSFSHTSVDGRSWVKRQLAAGWKSPGGENIARGYDKPSSVMTAWMNSPGHRRNILNCQFRYIGIGYNTTGEYSVQNFGY
ncbi:CAP domain-containing protein [Sporichthya polymorpha]|uniref:CAP domain-containing protein n=1 Tax=Sporichthya polymorpha TaxID=35751 RepID=UPI0003635C64|nr:CAP domain-containing protein [Sporichthya polymorpha]